MQKQVERLTNGTTNIQNKKDFYEKLTMKVNNFESNMRSKISGSQSPKLTNIRITPTASQTNLNDNHSSNSPQRYPYTYTVTSTSAPQDEINQIVPPTTIEKHYSREAISPIPQHMSLDSSKEQIDFATLPKTVTTPPIRPMTAQGRRGARQQADNTGVIGANEDQELLDP